MRTPWMRSRSWMRAAASSEYEVTSRWVTPAYRRSALPGGQHISSTQANPSSAANANTSSSDRSPRMADTNPSFMGALRASCLVFGFGERGREPPVLLNNSFHVGGQQGLTPPLAKHQ